ncbi:hypothetical protein M0R45_021122 [Rubus argutus]|uniref:Uncharacterized protein n=1 Tax=Rubus argutus TaxID=59490 RepID=A0AAW1XAF6_RUBAR
MESFGGCGFSAGGCIVRKKRSVVSHKPRLDPLTFSERSNFFLPIGNPFGKESLADSGVGGASSVPKSSCRSDDFIPQPKPLLQDDINGKRFCSSDGDKGLGVKRKYSLKYDSTSRKEYSSKGKSPGEVFLRMTNQLVRASGFLRDVSWMWDLVKMVMKMRKSDSLKD